MVTGPIGAPAVKLVEEDPHPGLAAILQLRAGELIVLETKRRPAALFNAVRLNGFFICMCLI